MRHQASRDQSMKFERNRAIAGWIIDNFANFCKRYVTLWPWPLSSFIALRASCD